MNYYRYYFHFYLLWFSIVNFFSIKGDIAFGHGLGDLYYLVMLLIFTIIGSIAFLRISQRKLGNLSIYLLVIYLTLVLIFFCLKLTYLRGAEYPWNGTIFLWTKQGQLKVREENTTSAWKCHANHNQQCRRIWKILFVCNFEVRCANTSKNINFIYLSFFTKKLFESKVTVKNLK